MQAINLVEGMAEGAQKGKGGAGFAGLPSNQDVASFKAFMGDQTSGESTVKGFVEGAERKVSDLDLNLKVSLNKFNARDSAASLIEALHVSSLRSVSVQLSSKIASKSGENFEQLLKQQ
ncbi:MAG: hypothetical protein HC848_05365 [Limnobacter sp.]|nr:hypothetical protein [Limnobacter sp.]